MKIAFIGTGKLGLPVAIGIDYKGHQVLGYDINPAISEDKKASELLFTKEIWFDGQSDLKEKSVESGVKFTRDLSKVIEFSDIIFCAVQTPHDPLYEGVNRIPETRKDFDYTYLINSMKDISAEVERQGEDKIVVVISTVLPGTIRKHILPILSPKVKLCYNPYFIAMGTVIPDFFFPEFILLGVVDENAKNKVIEFYKTITDSPVFQTNLENAEMIKVSYNTFITTKVCIANVIMTMCDRLPNTNCDTVMDALFLSHRRIISTKYLRGGMGDGGGCHPRDNIALSWLSNELGMNYNFYDDMMKIREYQTDYIANIVEKYYQETKLPVILLGKSFKAETNLTTGSPAYLLKNILAEKQIPVEDHFDPYVDETEFNFKEKAIYCLATDHKIFSTYDYPDGSILIDPFRMCKEKKNVTYYAIGIGNH